MDIAIKNADELYKYFFDLSRKNTLNPDGKQHKLEVFVSTKIRREVMTSVEQGEIVLDGQVKRFVFKSLGGGVYKASVQTII